MYIIIARYHGITPEIVATYDAIDSRNNIIAALKIKYGAGWSFSTALANSKIGRELS